MRPGPTAWWSAAWPASAKVIGVLGIVDDHFLDDPVGGGDQLWDGGGGVAEDDEQGSLAVLAQVQGGLEDFPARPGGQAWPTALHQLANLVGIRGVASGRR